MPKRISVDLIKMLKERAQDPEARNDDYAKPGETSFMGGAFKTVRVAIGPASEPAAERVEAPPPATGESIAAAESALGLRLPDDLKQLYLEVGDGGFGPGMGLAPLGEIVESYRYRLRTCPEDCGHDWPARLLPITLSDLGQYVYDLESGRIGFWEAEMTEEEMSPEEWKDTFREEADSLEAWLTDWASKPSMAEYIRQHQENAIRKELKRSLDYWRSMTPEERAEYGLSEEEWEQELFGHLGIDVNEL